MWDTYYGASYEAMVGFACRDIGKATTFSADGGPQWGPKGATATLSTLARQIRKRNKPTFWRQARKGISRQTTGR